MTSVPVPAGVFIPADEALVVLRWLAVVVKREMAAGRGVPLEVLGFARAAEASEPPAPVSECRSVPSPLARRDVPSSWLTVKEASDRAGVSEEYARRLARSWRSRGLAEKVKGGSWRIDPAVLEGAL